MTAATGQRNTRAAIRRERDRLRERARDLAATQPWRVPGCARCGARLADDAGNPRWEVLEGSTFVCLERCPGAGS